MKLLLGDCLELMKTIPSGSVDLTVTSPPYDNLRSYNGMNDWGREKWKAILTELFRVTKSGGVVVWVVADATIKGSETGSSFQQALDGIACGFLLHDTMIYQTNKPPQNHNRYEQCFEFMFVFSKGKPSVANIARERSMFAGAKRTSTMRQDGDHLSNRSAKGFQKEDKPQKNIWYMPRGGGSHDELSVKHPATFPIELPTRHIESWSKSGDLVLDPFTGSGTTGVACVNTGREFIGIERDPEYFAIAEKRIREAELNTY